MRKIAIAGLLIAAAIPAHAQERPSFNDVDVGNGLYDSCADRSNVGEQALCIGYIMGASEVMRGWIFCPPAGATREQGQDIVLAGLRNHPEERQSLSANLIAKYLGAAWPCAQKGATH